MFSEFAPGSGHCQECVSSFGEPTRIADDGVLGPSNSRLSAGPNNSIRLSRIDWLYHPSRSWRGRWRETSLGQSSKSMVLAARNRWFESISLQRSVMQTDHLVQLARATKVGQVFGKVLQILGETPVSSEPAEDALVRCALVNSVVLTDGLVHLMPQLCGQ
jgi:hypothetical protein